MLYTTYLNGIIAERRYTRYLEIGSGYGSNFNNIVCSEKFSVDLHFHADFYGSSDDFFEKCAPRLDTFDLILVDASENKKQALHDLTHAYGLLAPGGMLVCLDVANKRFEAWKQFTVQNEGQFYVVSLGDSRSEMGVCDIRLLDTIHGLHHIALSHNFELAMPTVYHFAAEVLPNVYRTLHEAGMLTWGHRIQFYCDTFHEYLAFLSRLPVKPLAEAPEAAFDITEASRRTTRKDLASLQQFRNFVLRKFFTVGSLSHSEPFEHVLLVDRRNSRRLAYPGVLLAALKEKSPLPVHLVYLEDLSVTDHIKLFRKAAVVVAVHGAAETNAFWMQAGAHLIELMVPQYPTDLYLEFARHFGVEYTYAEPINPWEEFEGKSKLEIDQIPLQYQHNDVAQFLDDVLKQIWSRDISV